MPTLGGAELVVDSLSREMLQLGCEPVVIAPRKKWWHFPDDSLLPYKVVRYPPHLSKRYFVESYIRPLRRAVSKYQFDLIHVHEVWPHAYLAARLKQECGRLPLVLTSHGSDAMLSNPRYKQPLILGKARWGMNQMDALVANSPSMRENLLEMSSHHSAFEIPNGVYTSEDCAHIKRTTSGEVLFIGRLTHRKGVHILIEAMSCLSPDSYSLLRIAGWGRERVRLEALVRRLGLCDKVTFEGKVADAQKQKLLMKADVVVIPTLDWEACSLVALESFASGCPIVASDIPGISHFIRQDEVGRLVEPGNPRALASAIADILLDETARISMGDRARTLAKAYDWKNIGSQHLRLYQSLVAEKHLHE